MSKSLYFNPLDWEKSLKDKLRTLGNNARDFSNQTDGGPVNGMSQDAGSVYLFYQISKTISVYACITWASATHILEKLNAENL